MSASFGDNNSQEVDLNLAPIIDCFTVLITYLLVTASFLTLSTVDVGVSASGTGPAPAEPVEPAPAPLIMTLELKGTGEFVINVRGGEASINVTHTVAARNGWDLDGLDAKLEELMRTYPTLTEVSVSAEASVIYRDIVQVIHKIQERIEKVYIAS